MKAQAIEKINKEMQEKNNAYTKVIGGYLLEQIERNQEIAEKIMDEKKSIEKSLKEMRKAAEKQKIDNCAVLTDEEGFKIVAEYYRFEIKEKTDQPESEQEEKQFLDVKLEDFM